MELPEEKTSALGVVKSFIKTPFVNCETELKNKGYKKIDNQNLIKYMVTSGQSKFMYNNNDYQLHTVDMVIVKNEETIMNPFKTFTPTKILNGNNCYPVNRLFLTSDRKTTKYNDNSGVTASINEYSNPYDYHFLMVYNNASAEEAEEIIVPYDAIFEKRYTLYERSPPHGGYRKKSRKQPRKKSRKQKKTKKSRKQTRRTRH